MQLSEIRLQLENIDWNKIENKTQWAFARSNRLNFMVVGLCGLVEAYLNELAKKQEGFDPSDINDSIDGLKKFLKKTNTLDFPNLKNWDSFQSVKKVRNVIVHAYGGMITKETPGKLLNQFKKLNLNRYLIGDRRIRLDSDALDQIINIVDGLIQEIGNQAE